MKIQQNLDKTVIAAYEYEHNDGDQIWSDTTTYYKKDDGTYEKEYIDGYYGESCTSPITLDEIISRMKEVEHEVRKKQEAISIHGINSPITRGGYSITKKYEKELKMKDMQTYANEYQTKHRKHGTVSDVNDYRFKFTEFPKDKLHNPKYYYVYLSYFC